MWLSENKCSLGTQMYFLPVGQASGAWENVSQPGHALGCPFKAKGIQLGEQASSRDRSGGWDGNNDWTLQVQPAN